MIVSVIIMMVKSLDQGVIAEVVEHNMRGRYSSDKTSDE
jgi:hypothetical protein